DRPQDVGERATQAITTILPGDSHAANGLVAAEGAGRDRGRGTPSIIEGARKPLIDEAAPCVAGAADGLVASERAAADDQGRLRACKCSVLDRTTDAPAQNGNGAGAGVAAASQSLVVIEVTVGNRGRPHDAQRPAGAD